MNMKSELKKMILDDYYHRTASSKIYIEKSRSKLPGGNTRTISHYDPYPFVAKYGKGCILVDIDGNKYLDLVNNMTALIHGHAHPTIHTAITNQSHKGTVHSAPVEIQYKFADLLCNRVKSLDSIRFCNSGTEATMFAIRVARHYTKREKVVKIDGGYHGAHEFVEVNITPEMNGSRSFHSRVENGIPASVASEVFIVPLNDIEYSRNLITKHKDEIAAVIIEPILGRSGGLEADLEYLKFLREITSKFGILLIFDEIVTYRFHEGGYQELLGITPDLTTLGKIIGGGLPIGAFGGTQEVMQVLDVKYPNYLLHSGSFSGNAITLAAGYAAMEIYRQPEIDRISTLGDNMKWRLNRFFSDFEAEVKPHVHGTGSLLVMDYVTEKTHNVGDYYKALLPSLQFSKYMNLMFQNQGLFSLTRGFHLLSLSTPMNAKTISSIITKIENSFLKIFP